ncbi:hypothetical protein J8273_7254 [Carpediemonas membranifera]|uniref:Uncharacterized protein n=1 Tax=Carpediemonas membranifera TaxID=201153 RepID=A0A8J6AS70_9EUKA|nr:hypothetical protein J8273_7254 [Carpediemonas membranifera]|eukprot:KAG9390980.1 hypothetical protein J8273_7254 [Carpediemonas membranifera]
MGERTILAVPKRRQVNEEIVRDANDARIPADSRRHFSPAERRHEAPAVYRSYRRHRSSNERNMKLRHDPSFCADAAWAPSSVDLKLTNASDGGMTRTKRLLPADVFSSTVDSARHQFYRDNAVKRIPNKLQRSLEMLSPDAVEALISDTHKHMDAQQALEIEGKLWGKLDSADGPVAQKPPPSRRDPTDWAALSAEDILRDFVLGPMSHVMEDANDLTRQRAQRLAGRSYAGSMRSVTVGPYVRRPGQRFTAPVLSSHPADTGRDTGLRGIPAQPLGTTARAVVGARVSTDLGRARFEGAAVRALQTLRPTIVSVL